MKKLFKGFVVFLAFCSVIFVTTLAIYSGGDAKRYDSYDVIHAVTYLGYHKTGTIYIAEIKNPQWGSWNGDFEIVIDELINANLKPGDTIYFVSIKIQGSPMINVIISEYQMKKEVAKGKILLNHIRD